MHITQRLSKAFIALIATIGGVAGLAAQSVSFAKASYTVIGDPRAIVTADFNHDGRADIAVASINADGPTVGAVTIFGNTSDGSFSAQKVLQMTAGPFAMVTGDFDNDGDADLAVVNADAQVVNVQLHKKGTAFDFFSPGSYVRNASPRGIATADFNRDGRLDLAITSLACNCVDIALGNGNGTFLSRFTAPVAAGPVDVAAVDIDHDGLPDLVVGGSSAVTVLFGSGSGTFGGRRDEGIGVAVQSVKAAQLNHNDRVDVVAVGRNFLVSLWDVTRAGSGMMGGQGTGGNDARGVATVDINGDGIADLIVANRDNGRVAVFIASTSINSCGDECAPGYSLGATLKAGAGARAIAIGDFNADGRPDIATADQSGHSMTVFLNTTPFVGRP